MKSWILDWNPGIQTHRLSQRDRVYAIRKLIEEEVMEVRNKGLIVEVFEINK